MDLEISRVQSVSGMQVNLLQCLLVHFLEEVPDHSEFRQCAPAGLYGTRSTDSVALAHSSHLFSYGHSASLVVVQICKGDLVAAFGLKGVQKLLSHLTAEVKVVAAATPLPAIF